MKPKRVCCGYVLVALGACLPLSARADTFTLIALPDTQFYCRYSDLSFYSNYENPFMTQTQWIVDSTVDDNIRFTMHLGDVVDQSAVDAEWQYADLAMSILDDSDIHYGACRGNHDVYGDTFVNYFGPSRFAGMPTYQGADSSGINSYHIFTADDREFLVLFVDWRMSAGAVDWAHDVLAAHANLPTILIAHQILNVDGNHPALPVWTDNGLFLWDEFVAENDQIFMTINGHHHGTAWWVMPNSYGRDVLQMVVDYQSAFANGAGYLRILTFDTDANTITGRTFSPWLDKARLEGVVVAPNWVLTEITDPDAYFVVPMNFAERFTPLCRGDANDDGVVNLLDVAIAQREFGQTGPGLGSDADGDDDVDFDDVTILLGAIGTDC
jgi:hypothetical protein